MKNIDQTPHRRLPAEWEPQSAVQLTFPHEGTDWADVLEEVLPCFIKIAETISRFEKVVIVCRNIPETQNLLSGGITSNYVLVEAPSNDTWARDHGGIAIEEGGKPVLLDFVFNGWGLKFPADKDNLITRHLYEKGVIKTDLRHGGLVLEGGGIESDGAGVLLTTAECLLSPNRNPHLKAHEIEAVLKDTFGLKKVLWLQNGYLAGDDTDSHIDTLARFSDPDTILYVSCPDTTDEHYPALKKMEQELQRFTKLDGSAYTLVPLPWPDACYDLNGQRLPATYANFLIINGAVLVPTYQVKQDEEALAVFQTIFRGREIIGIDCRPLIEQHGSLHCVTMQYPLGFV
jgi:agmatine deiminase